MMTIEEKRKHLEALRARATAAEPSEEEKLDREIVRAELEAAEKEAAAKVARKRAEAEVHILAAQREHGSIAEGKILVIDTFGDIVILAGGAEGRFMQSVEQSAAAPSHSVKMDIERELVLSYLYWCTGTTAEVTKAEAFQRLDATREGLFLACSKGVGKLAGLQAEERAGK